MRFLIFHQLFFLLSVSGWAQQDLVKFDLRPQWEMYEDGLKPYQPNANTIYVRINASMFSGDYLLIESYRGVTLFINGALAVREQKHLRLNLDSLAHRYGNSLWLGLRDGHPQSLSTKIISPVLSSRAEEVYQQHTSRDFVLVALLWLITLLVTLVYLNPRLAADYFSVTRLFSLRERDEVQLATRITNSTNILFYVFASLLLGLYLLIIFSETKTAYSAFFKADDFWPATLNWLKLTVVVLLFFIVKILWVHLVSALFAWQEHTSFQYFNWTRLVLIMHVPLVLAGTLYFILYGTSSAVYETLLQITSAMLIAWPIIIFLKFYRRVNTSLFHIFSYLCATELIPLLITLNVLLD
jgi:hypothetical protein